MARTTTPKTIQCTDLEWEQIRAYAKQADIPISCYVMACLFDRQPGGDAPDNNDPGGTRTPYLQIRNLSLYPDELRDHSIYMPYFTKKHHPWHI